MPGSSHSEPWGPDVSDVAFGRAPLSLGVEGGRRMMEKVWDEDDAAHYELAAREH